MSVEGARAARVAAVAAALIMVATACTGGAQPPITIHPRPSEPSTLSRGGPIFFGAEGWPECLNPITSCGSGTWARYTVLQHVLPRAMQLDAEGNYVPSPLLTQAPSLSNGGLRLGPPFTVAFHIRNQAAWEDGSPITSQDFEFTWRAIVYTKGSTDAGRFRSIRSIDTTDPKTAIVEFRDVTAQWPEFFGGSRGFILKRAAFPRADLVRPNLRKAMDRSIRFSGGPWLLDSWSGAQAILVRNDRYYGRRAGLDYVVFVPRPDQATEANSLLTGEVAAVYAEPSFGQPGEANMLATLGANPAVKAVGSNGTRFEALWLDTRIPPLNDRNVREALMHAIDRQAVVDSVVKLNNPRAEVLNCGFVALPDFGPWCSSRPFEGFAYDPSTAKALLKKAGYDCSSTPCTKGGAPLRVKYITHATSPLQTNTQILVKRRAAHAGFDMKIVSFEAGVLFGTICPIIDIHVSQCAIPAPASGSVTDILGCAAIPVKRNDFVGENRIEWCNREADRLMLESDQELDPARRLELVSRVHQIEGEVLMGLPLFVVPVVSAWRTDKIAGPIGRYSSTPHGMFFNMNEWHVPASN